MFREEYIKANEQIKPDDDFLNRLKEAVVQEDTVIHIGEYIDLKNTTNIADLEETVSTSGKVANLKERITWRNFVVIAACFVFVFTLSFVAGKMDISYNNKGLQAGMEAVVDSDAESADIMENTEVQEQYQKVRRMFNTMSVVIYETEKFHQEQSGIEYLQELREGQCELEPALRDELVGDILAQRYEAKDSLEEFESASYYVAEFEDQSWVRFVIDEDGYIYIAEVSGIQNLAFR